MNNGSALRKTTFPALLSLVFLLFVVVFGICAEAGTETVYHDVNFSSASDTISLKENYSTATLSNGTLRIDKVKGGDEVSSGSFTSASASSTVMIEFRIGAPADATTLATSIRLRNSKDNSYSFFQLSSGGAMTLQTGGLGTYSLGTLNPGEWADLAFAITVDSGNSSAMTVDAYVNGYLAWENIPFQATSGTLTAASKLSYYIYFVSGHQGAVLFDYLKVSTAPTPTKTNFSGAIAHLKGNDEGAPDQLLPYNYGEVMVLPTAAEMIRPGYAFTGWYTNAEATGEPVTAIYSDERAPRVLYAGWKVKKYTVIWNVDGSLVSEQYEYGEIPSYMGETDKAATAEHSYTFSGWYDGTIKAYVLPPVTKDVSYTAQYIVSPGFTTYYHRTYEGANPLKGLTAGTKETSVLTSVTEGGNTFLSYTANSTVTSDSLIDVSCKASDFIVMQISLSTTNQMPKGRIQYKTSDGSSIQIATLASTGAVRAGGQDLGFLTPGKWLHLTFVLNLSAHTLTAYANGVAVVTDYTYSTSDQVGATSMRIYFNDESVNANRNLLIDNYAIYSGSTVRELPDPEEYGSDDPAKMAESELDGSVAMKLNVDAMLVGGMAGQRVEIPAPKTYLGLTYVPIAALADAFGYTVEGTDSLTLTGEHVITGLTNDSTVYKNGAVYLPQNPVIRYDGTVMVSLADAALLLEKALYSDTMGLIIFSDNSRIADIQIKRDRSLLVLLMDEFVFDLPTGDQMLSEMQSHMDARHPRLIASAAQFAAARAAYTASADSIVKSWVTKLVSSADTYLSKPDPVYGYDEGSRMSIEADYIDSWSFAWQMTLDMKYADRALKWLYALSQFDDWCPGHSLNSADISQSVAIAYDWMYDAWNMSGYWTTAKITSLLGADALSSFLTNTDGTLNVSRLIEDTLYYYGIASAIGSFNKTTNQSTGHGNFGRYGWTTTNNNWNAVCNTGYLMAAFALAGSETRLADNTVPTIVAPLFSSNAEVNTPGTAKPGLLGNTAYSTATATASTTYTDEISWLLTKIMNSIRIGVHCYAPDGSYGESAGYWSYGTNRLFRLIETLYTATGTTYGLMEAAGMDRTLYFAMNIESSDNHTWNYHDGTTGAMPTEHAAFAGVYYGDTNLTSLRYSSVLSGAKGVTFIDVLYYDPDMITGAGTLPLDYLMTGIDTSTMRSSWEKGAIFAGLHGGYNSMNHGDIDAGNFIYDAEGIRWFTDLGGDYYNLSGYFGKGEDGGSWKYYKKTSEGQNTVIIVGDKDVPYGQDPTVTIPVTKHYSVPSHVYTVLDMTTAYGANTIKGERAMLMMCDSGAVVIQDEISFREETSLYWLAHTTESVTVSENGRTAYLTATSGTETYTLRATLLSDDPSLSFTVTDAYTLLLPNTAANVAKEHNRSAYKRLAIYAHNVTEFNVSVVLEMVDSPDAPVSYTQTPIARWENPGYAFITTEIGETVNTTPVKLDHNYTVPNDASVWLGSDGNVYKAGDTFTVEDDLTLTAVTVELLDGASIRTIGNESGLRFESEIPLALIKKAEELGIELVAGTVILPTDRLTVPFTKEALDMVGIEYIDLYTTTFAIQGDIAHWNASIINLYKENYTREFSAISYVTVSANGRSCTAYSDYDEDDNARSVYYVASMLYATRSDEYSDTKLAIIRSFIDSVIEIRSNPTTRRPVIFNSVIDALDPARVTLPYISPYAVTYDEKADAICIENGVGISTICIDGFAYTSGWTVEEDGTVKIPYSYLGDIPNEELAHDIFNDGFGEQFGS